METKDMMLSRLRAKLAKYDLSPRYIAPADHDVDPCIEVVDGHGREVGVSIVLCYDRSFDVMVAKGEVFNMSPSTRDWQRAVDTCVEKVTEQVRA